MSKIKLFKAVVDDIKALSESLEDLYYCLETGEISNRILEKQVKASKENLKKAGEISNRILEEQVKASKENLEKAGETSNRILEEQVKASKENLEKAGETSNRILEEQVKASKENLEKAGETSNRILEKQVNLSNDNLEDTSEISKNSEKTSKGSVKEETKITLEEVRTVLAIKAQEGKQKEIKALINAYDATKLSEVDPKWYREILEQAGGL